MQRATNTAEPTSSRRESFEGTMVSLGDEPPRFKRHFRAELSPHERSFLSANEHPVLATGSRTTYVVSYDRCNDSVKIYEIDGDEVSDFWEIPESVAVKHPSFSDVRVSMYLLLAIGDGRRQAIREMQAETARLRQETSETQRETTESWKQAGRSSKDASESYEKASEHYRETSRIYRSLKGKN